MRREGFIRGLRTPFIPGPATGAAPGRVGIRPGVIALSVIVATLHTGVALLSYYPNSIVAWAYPLAVCSVGLLAIALIPGQLARAYRWAALIGLSMIVFPTWFFLVMIVGESWALYRAWTEATPQMFAERHGRLRALRPARSER